MSSKKSREELDELTQEAIKLLKENLRSNDPKIAQEAAEKILKYSTIKEQVIKQPKIVISFKEEDELNEDGEK